MERKRLTSRQGVGRLGFEIGFVLLIVIVFPLPGSDYEQEHEHDFGRVVFRRLTSPWNVANVPPLFCGAAWR